MQALQSAVLEPEAQPDPGRRQVLVQEERLTARQLLQPMNGREWLVMIGSSAGPPAVRAGLMRGDGDGGLAEQVAEVAHMGGQVWLAPGVLCALLGR